MLDMEGSKLEFVNMGLFVTDEVWLHPERRESTYELVHVVSGTVYLEDGGERHVLQEGSVRLLYPRQMHRGWRESTGRTSFYWAHFTLDGALPDVPVQLARFPHASLFRELLHYSTLPGHPPLLPDAILAHILMEMAAEAAEQAGAPSRVAGEVYEWVRINVSAKLTVAATALRFGYHPEHLSRIVRRRYGVGLKALIDDFLIRRAKELLCNTSESVKQIAARLAFDDQNAFIHFYKYHEHTTPARYRNAYHSTHMNRQ